MNQIARAHPMTPGAADAFALPERLLEQCAQRAAALDRDAAFFDEDLAALRQCGFLKMALPAAHGGAGCDMRVSLRELARLARVAPPTALGLNMHLLAAGVAAESAARGDHTLNALLVAASAGRLIAAGISEPGNDFPGFQALTSAVRTGDGYLFNGRKMFTSMAPAWDDLLICGLEQPADGPPQIVYALLAREAGGAESVGPWDPVGMRATQSRGTVLKDAFVPHARVLSRIAPGKPDAFVVAAFTWGLLGFAAIYLAIARRGLDLAIEGVRGAAPLSLPGGKMRHPEVQHLIADMARDLWAAEAMLNQAIGDWMAGAGSDPLWMARLLATKHHAVESAWTIVDRAVEVAGGAAMFRGHELERLFRDARCGRLHPGSAAMTREVVAKSLLGIALDETPRWG